MDKKNISVNLKKTNQKIYHKDNLQVLSNVKKKLKGSKKPAKKVKAKSKKKTGKKKKLENHLF